MNNLFKNEFKNLNADDIKELINRCAGQDILQVDIINNIHLSDPKVAYFIKYIEDDKYGFWNVEWDFKKGNNFMGSGFFQNRIKITPFNIETEGISSPYSKPNAKKHLQEYLQIYINKKCPSYKQAIMKETEKFIKFLDQGENTL